MTSRLTRVGGFRQAVTTAASPTIAAAFRVSEISNCGHKACARFRPNANAVTWQAGRDHNFQDGHRELTVARTMWSRAVSDIY
jgi:hypothetical protein